MAVASAAVRKTRRVLSKIAQEKGEAGKPVVRRRVRRAAQIPEQEELPPRRASAQAGASAQDEPLGLRMELLWAGIQKEMLSLLAHGLAAPFQRSAFDKLAYAMKHLEKLQAMAAAEKEKSGPSELDPDELAALLAKIDRRIDALAEDRFKKLGDGELHNPGNDASHAGVDV